MTDWRARLEEAPAVVDLPVSDVAEDVSGPVLLPEAPVEHWGCYLAGLAQRYTQTDGPVVVTVAQHDTFVPVVLDLTSVPDLDAALAVWRSAWAELAPSALTAQALALVVDELPAAGQVLLQLDSTSWPSETLPAIWVRAGQTGPTELVAAGPAARVVAAHLAAVATCWHGGTALSAFPLLDAAGLSEVASHGRGPVQDVAGRTVWGLVVDTATRVPDAEAVRDRRRSLTYADLVAEVESLAEALARVGVGRATLVGLCVDRRVEMVVAMLAVHRCGAAYVPIDPAYPSERIAMMVEDAALGAVLTESALLHVIDALDLPRILVDEPRPGAGTGIHGLTPARVEDLAYVIFTSGSTGRPKGVMIGQRALANFVLSMAQTPGLVAGDRLLAVTTLSFDIAELELLVPLTVGGTVVVADRLTSMDPRALAEQLEDDDISVMQATPATWRMLVDSGWSGRPELKVLCGGEALPRSLADEVVPRCAELWNMYGPTETTIWSMVGRVAAGDGELVIGDPIHNTTIVVADRWGHALPDGIAGELMIGGDGVAQGYLGRPDLTEERFVADTLTGTAGPIYRTGDLVRRVPGRGIEFIGRIDGQVKVRGFRIELAEVESALEAHPAVGRAVAVTRPDPLSGANRLLAYVVLRATGAVDGLALRRQVGERLPEYMVPAVITLLTEFPLTLNGKIDRKALPDPEPVDLSADHVEPRTPLEAQLIGVWERVLRVDGIGVTDDVFDLGSNSLVTARLFAAVSAELGVDLPIAAAFEARTVASLAALVEQLRGGVNRPANISSLAPIRTTGTARPLFLVHGGAGTVLLYEPLARRLPDDQPVYALQAAGLYGDRAPQSSVPDMASLYVEEIATVQPHGPYRIGGYCFGALVAFEMAAQLEARGEEVELLISFNGPSPSYLRRYKPSFDAEGPLTDEAGERVRGRASLRQSAAGSNVARRLLHRARWKAHRLPRRARIEASLLLRRPLPDDLREAGVFQWIAARAQDAYHPGRIAVDMVVVSGEGLYYREDVGWGDHVDGRVDVVVVEGAHLTPRSSMRAEAVAPIASAVSERLTQLTGQ